MLFDYQLNLDIHQEKFCKGSLSQAKKGFLNGQIVPSLRDELKIGQDLKLENNPANQLKDLSQKKMLSNIENRERLHNVWENMRANQDLRAKNNIVARDIEQELRDLRKIKGKLELQDREKELKEVQEKQHSIKEAIRMYTESETQEAPSQPSEAKIVNRLQKSSFLNLQNESRSPYKNARSSSVEPRPTQPFSFIIPKTPPNFKELVPLVPKVDQ